MLVQDDSNTTVMWEPPVDYHRRRATHLYGLIISGAVLATVSTEFRLTRVAFALVSTLLIYWIAETYVHLLATRGMQKRRLERREMLAITLDGWPLVAASGVPLVVLAIEALLKLETARALEIALSVNAVLLFGMGWRISRDGGLTGIRLLLSAGLAGLLGIAMVVLKVQLH